MMNKMEPKSLWVAAKIFLCILPFLSLFLFQTVTAKSDAETVVKVEPYASFTRVGETFTVNITVVNVQNLYGVEITLHWNASILEMVNADVRLGVESHPDGVLHNLSSAKISIYKNEILQDQGKYVLAGSSTNPAPSFNGSGNIVRVTFNVSTLGSCNLSLVESKLASNKMTLTGVAPIPHITIDGFFGPIQIIALPKTVTVGEKINISGFIVPTQVNVSVTISYRYFEETEWYPLETVETNKQGNYFYIWTPKESGKYYLKSMATILEVEATSPIISVDVKKHPQFPWLYIGILAIIMVIGIAVFFIYRKKT